VSKRRRPSTERDLELKAAPAIEKIDSMKITKNIGMILLAIYLIVDGLLGFGLNLGPAIFLLYLVALAAGLFILIGK
jgi:NAD(P)H-hydrate repair Nnr-like enzyme with NAD(P)H-hydrate epimerase domain